MRRRRLPLGVLVPAGMVVLVCTLAILQYRWLGQVSEAEAEQLRASLDRSAHEFAADFDREVSGIYLALQPVNSEALGARDAADVASRLARWREASRFPEIVRDVYFSSGDRPLLRLDEGATTLEDTEWPPQLEPVRAQLRPVSLPVDPGDGAKGTFEFRLSPMMPEVPAVIVPVYATASPPAATPEGAVVGNAVRFLDRLEIEDMRAELHVSRDVVIVTLDEAFLRETMLPTLAERHFPQGADSYRISIVDRNAAPVASRPSTGPVVTAEDADIVVPFFGLRVNTLRPASLAQPAHLMAWSVTRGEGSVAPEGSAGRPPSTAATARIQPLASDRTMTVILSEQAAALGDLAAMTRTTEGAIRFAPAGWQIRVQHADGSLEAAVANARTRNLWLSFGMLALLTASVGLVVINARRSERLAARQMDFVATVSHELRTPLAVIRSAAQNLQAGVVLDTAQTRRYGDLIEDEGRRLTDMVEQVLEYAGLSGNRAPVRARPVDVRAVAADAVDGCRALVDDGGFEVEVRIPADLPPVLADEEALRRAIQNLVTNALKYAAEGRWLGVTAERGSAGGRPEVRVSVADRGPGIAAEDLPHIFEPFYRGRDAQDRQIHGNGLGLSLVRRIAEAHGGRLTVRSTPGQGATFTLHLPMVSGEAGPALPMGQTHSA